MKATLHYILRTDRPRPDGSAIIYLRLTIDRRNKPMFSMYRNIPLKGKYKHLTLEQIESYPIRREQGDLTTVTRDELYCWDKAKGRALRGFGSSESLNQFLNEEMVRAEDIINDLAKRRKPLTADIFIRAFKKTNTDLTFYDYCHQQVVVNMGNTYAEDTIKGYMAQINKLEKFKPGIRMGDIDYKLLTNYFNWVQRPISKGGLGNIPSTANKNMKVIRTMILLAIKNDDFPEEHYPFKNFRISERSSELTSRDFLEPEEILKLEALLAKYYPPKSADPNRLSKEEWQERMEAGILTTTQYETLRSFLFACYTGLRFRDMSLFDAQEHVQGKWVENPYTFEKKFRHYVDVQAMHKTGKALIVPLIDKALLLLDLKKQGATFKVISNQKTNANLKCIAKLAGINKKLTFHVARHTFATTCFTYGIPAEVGQRLLGHKSEKFIKVYTHLTQNRLFHEMDKVNSGFNEHEQLLQVVHKQTDPEVKKMPNKNLQRLIALLGEMDDDKIAKIETIAKVVG